MLQCFAPMAEMKDNLQDSAHIVREPLKETPERSGGPRWKEHRNYFNFKGANEQNHSETNNTGGLTGLARLDDPLQSTLSRPILAKVSVNGGHLGLLGGEFSCSFRAQSNTALTEPRKTFGHSIKQAEIQLLDSPSHQRDWIVHNNVLKCITSTVTTLRSVRLSR